MYPLDILNMIDLNTISSTKRKNFKEHINYFFNDCFKNFKNLNDKIKHKKISENVANTNNDKKEENNGNLNEKHKEQNIDNVLNTRKVPFDGHILDEQTSCNDKDDDNLESEKKTFNKCTSVTKNESNNMILRGDKNNDIIKKMRTNDRSLA